MFSQPRPYSPSAISFARPHLKALGEPHKALLPLLNRSSISKFFGCREVASDIEAKRLSHWLCCVLLATTGPLIHDHLLRHLAPSLLAFVPPGLKHTTSFDHECRHTPGPPWACQDFWLLSLTKPLTWRSLAPGSSSHLTHILGACTHSPTLGYFRPDTLPCVYDSWSPTVQITPCR